MQSLKQGSLLQGGKYRIGNILGTGSFGITYLATTRIKMQAAISGSLGRLVQDQEVEVKVCIKEFFMKDVNSRGRDGISVEGTSNTLYTNYRKRFRKEAENLSRLEHPNIVKVLEVFDENDTTYYVMQFIEGKTLDEYIKDTSLGHLEEQEAKEIILSIANALQYMHERRMLHLDLKPKNIMRGTDGTEFIIDFGLSKQYDEKGEPESSTAIGLGTPGYAPTEQTDNIPDGTFPATLDIYALGATLLKMLTGKTPPTANEVLNDGLPPRPGHVSEKMWNVVEQAMQPLKKNRLQSVAEFIAVLNADNIEGNTQVTPEGDEETEVISVIKAEPEPKLAPEPNPKSEPSPIPWKKYALLALLYVGIAAAAFFSWRLIGGSGKDTGSTTNEVSDGYSYNNEKIAITANGVSFNMIRVEGASSGTFYLGETEVTQALWEAVMGSNSSYFKGANRPVEKVSWNDCKEFISRLNSITGKTFRLPKEAEWEYAAKGGNKSHGYEYSGSYEINDVAWYGSNGLGSSSPNYGTHNVKTKMANELGIYDMSGNVCEWCEDLYDSSGSNRVNRGGGWSSDAGRCRVSSRGNNAPGDRFLNLGFRLAL